MKRNLSQEMNKLQFRTRNRKCKKTQLLQKLLSLQLWNLKITELGKISNNSSEILLVVVISDLKEDVRKDMNSKRWSQECEVSNLEKWFAKWRKKISNILKSSM